MSLNMEAIKKSVDDLKSKGFQKREIEICQHCGWVGLRVMANMERSLVKKKFVLCEISCGGCLKNIRTFFAIGKEHNDEHRQGVGENQGRKRYLA